MDPTMRAQQAALQPQGQRQMPRMAQPALFQDPDVTQALTHEQMVAMMSHSHRVQMAQQSPIQQYHAARQMQGPPQSPQPAQAPRFFDHITGQVYTQEQAVMVRRERQMAYRGMMAQEERGQQQTSQTPQGAQQPSQLQAQSQAHEMQLWQATFQERARQQAVPHQTQMMQQSPRPLQAQSRPPSQPQLQSQSPLQMQSIQQVSPAARMNPGQRYFTDQSGGTWIREQWNAIAQRQAAQAGQHAKRPRGPKDGVQKQQRVQNHARQQPSKVLSQNRVPHTVQAHIPAVSPAQKQTLTPVATPVQKQTTTSAAIPAQTKTLSVNPSATQTHTPKPSPHPNATQSSNPTRSLASTQPSAPIQPSIPTRPFKATRFQNTPRRSIRNAPPKPPKSPRSIDNDPAVVAARNGVCMAGVENGTEICDAMTTYLTTYEEAHTRAVAAQANTPDQTMHNSSSRTMAAGYAASLGLPTDFDMRPVLDRVRDPMYDGFASYDGMTGGMVLDSELERSCTRDPGGSWRAKESGWSESRAELEYQMRVTVDEREKKENERGGDEFDDAYWNSIDWTEVDRS